MSKYQVQAHHTANFELGFIEVPLLGNANMNNFQKRRSVSMKWGDAIKNDKEALALLTDGMFNDSILENRKWAVSRWISPNGEKILMTIACMDFDEAKSDFFISRYKNSGVGVDFEKYDTAEALPEDQVNKNIALMDKTIGNKLQGKARLRK